MLASNLGLLIELFESKAPNRSHQVPGTYFTFTYKNHNFLTQPHPLLT